MTCAAVKTILSEYRNPDAPPTFTAFGSPVASWPNSTADEGVETNKQKAKIVYINFLIMKPFCLSCLLTY